jgi:hypothetical protein
MKILLVPETSPNFMMKVTPLVDAIRRLNLLRRPPVLPVCNTNRAGSAASAQAPGCVMTRRSPAHGV